MEPNYDSPPVTHTSTTRCQCPPQYIQTVPGILKIVEMALSILTFACAFGGGYYFNYYYYRGGGWVEFVGIFSLIHIAIWFVLHLINLVPAILVNFLVEMIGYVIMTVLYLIAGIVAAAGAAKLAGYEGYNGAGSAGAASFFAFACMVVCGVDTALQFLAYRSGSHTTTTTTTTQSAYTSSSSVY